MTKSKKSGHGPSPCPKCRSTFRTLMEDNLLVCDDCGFSQRVGRSTFSEEDYDYDS